MLGLAGFARLIRRQDRSVRSPREWRRVRRRNDLHARPVQHGVVELPPRGPIRVAARRQREIGDQDAPPGSPSSVHARTCTHWALTTTTAPVIRLPWMAQCTDRCRRGERQLVRAPVPGRDTAARETRHPDRRHVVRYRTGLDPRPGHFAPTTTVSTAAFTEPFRSLRKGNRNVGICGPLRWRRSWLSAPDGNPPTSQEGRVAPRPGSGTTGSARRTWIQTLISVAGVG